MTLCSAAETGDFPAVERTDGAGVRVTRPCPQPCPELGESDLTQPHLDEPKRAQTSTKGLQIEHFETGGPWQPRVGRFDPFAAP